MNNKIYKQYFAGTQKTCVEDYMADTSSATCTSQTRDEVPDGTFFLLVSKGFSKAIRLSETGDVAEIGL
jgi:hypothetical protein